MKNKVMVSKKHLKDDTKKAKKIINASEKIEKLGESIVKKDKKVRTCK